MVHVFGKRCARDTSSAKASASLVRLNGEGESRWPGGGSGGETCGQAQVMLANELTEGYDRIVWIAQDRGERAARAADAARMGELCSLAARCRGVVVGIRLYLVVLAKSRGSGSDLGFTGEQQRKAQDRRESAADDCAYIGLPARIHSLTPTYDTICTASVRHTDARQD